MAFNSSLSAICKLVVFDDGPLPHEQSISLFSRALLVGPHGGAFLNALFLRRCRSVVEIAYPSMKLMSFPPYYFLMSCGLRLFHHMHVAEHGDSDSDMTLNASRVVDSVHRALDWQW